MNAIVNNIIEGKSSSDANTERYGDGIVCVVAANQTVMFAFNIDYIGYR